MVTVLTYHTVDWGGDWNTLVPLATGSKVKQLPSQICESLCSTIECHKARFFSTFDKNQYFICFFGILPNFLWQIQSSCLVSQELLCLCVVLFHFNFLIPKWGFSNEVDHLILKIPHYIRTFLLLIQL